MEVGYILKLTRKLISESISDQNPAGLCFSTSIPLQIYLATKQIECNIIKGKVPQIVDGNIQYSSHYWLQIASTDIIIDGTIQQFENPDAIYVGRSQDNQITKTYIANGLAFDEWFRTDFKFWKMPYEEPTYPLDGDFEKRSILYTLKVATILHSEILGSDYNDEFINVQFGLYFKPIYIFLYHWYKKVIDFEIKREVMPVGFEDLLTNVLRWAEKERIRQCVQ